MSFEIKKKGAKQSDEQKDIVNLDWIAENRQRAAEWCAENHHLMGNSKGDITKPEVFYSLSDTCLVLSLRYPNSAEKGNVASPISFNKDRHNFRASLEKELIALISLKHEYLLRI